MNSQEMAEEHGRGGGGREFRRKVLTLRGLLRDSMENQYSRNFLKYIHIVYLNEITK